MIYLNIKTKQGTETIDQIDRKDFATFKDFKKELNNRIFNYAMAGILVYKSQKKCKYW
jgi:hypothetical protein